MRRAARIDLKTYHIVSMTKMAWIMKYTCVRIITRGGHIFCFLPCYCHSRLLKDPIALRYIFSLSRATADFTSPPAPPLFIYKMYNRMYPPIGLFPKNIYPYGQLAPPAVLNWDAFLRSACCILHYLSVCITAVRAGGERRLNLRRRGGAVRSVRI